MTLFFFFLFIYPNYFWLVYKCICRLLIAVAYTCTPQSLSRTLRLLALTSWSSGLIFGIGVGVDRGRKRTTSSDEHRMDSRIVNMIQVKQLLGGDNTAGTHVL